MQRTQKLAALAAIALVFGGCTARSTLPSAQLPPTSGSGSHGMAKATFIMHWPTSTSTKGKRSGGIHPHFISPSAQSVSVQVNSLPPTVVNRPSGGALPTSNIVIAAAVGNDVFSIKLYDQNNATGNLLGETAVSKTIVANTANTVSATVDGVLGIIAMGPGNLTQPFLEGNAVTGFTLVGALPEQFVLTPEDADGNAIIAPGAIPVISLASSSPSLTATFTGTTNVYNLQFTRAVSSPVSVVATSAGTSVSATLPIAESAALYVPNYFSDTLTVYDQDGNSIATLGVFPDLHQPFGAAFDSINGQIYATNSANSTIRVFDQNGNPVNVSGTFPNLNAPRGIAFDPLNSQLYVVNSGNSTITVYDPNGNQITGLSSFPNLSYPQSITFDSINGLLYVTNYNNNTVTVYDPFGNQVTTSGSFAGVSGPGGIVFDAVNGQLYVTNKPDAITTYDQNGNYIGFPGSFKGLGIPLDLMAVP